jgi:hypothetical protein
MYRVHTFKRGLVQVMPLARLLQALRSLSVHYMDWISHEEDRTLHGTDKRAPNRHQYKHILQNVISPSVRSLYRDRVIQF